MAIIAQSGVYSIVCSPTGKTYIGSSRNIEARWKRHKKDLKSHNHANQYLQRAWDKYGEKSFKFTVVEIVETDNLLAREQYWLDKLSPFGDNGFNIAIKAAAPTMGRKLSHGHKISTALTGYKHTEEARKRMSQAQMGNKKFLGHKHTPGTIERLREVNKGNKHGLGYKHTPEACKKIGDAHRGMIHSAETRERCGTINKGRVQSCTQVEARAEKHRKDFVVITPSGEEIPVHGLRQFCKEHGLNYKAMLDIAAHRPPNRYQHKGGWKCRFADLIDKGEQHDA